MVDNKVVSIDAFVVDISTINDDTNAQLRYNGVWGGSSGTVGTYNGTLHYSDSTSLLVRFTYTGDAITYIFSAANNRGYAAVTIDGVDYGYIDQWASTTARQQQRTFTPPSTNGRTQSVIRNYSFG